MRKKLMIFKRLIFGLVLSLMVFMSSLTVEASNSGQALPQTGEEMAKTGLVIGGIIIVIVIVIILIRRRKK